MHMSNTGTITLNTPALRNVGWTTVADASGPILRRAAQGAVMSDRRVQIAFNVDLGTYELALTSS
jgi:hypothetical protein